MTYDEFKAELLAQFTSFTDVKQDNIHFYPDGFEGDGSIADNEFIQSTNRFYHKPDSSKLDGDYIVVQEEASNYTNICRLSLAYLFDEYGKDGWDRVWYIANQNISFARRCNIDSIFGDETTYDDVKSRLIIRPINFSDNRTKLRGMCYRTVGDIALVLYAICATVEDVFSTVKVRREFLSQWHITEDTIFENAMLNTFITRPPRIYMTIADCTNPPYERGAFMAMGADYHIDGPSVSPTVSTYPNTNGAIALFYPGVRKKLAEIMGGSYYVAFTSIHEARLHLKGSVSPREVLMRLKNVNGAFDPEEILSRKVFYYDQDKKTFDVLSL